MAIQAANTASRYDPRMAAHYESVKNRNGGRHQIAVTHVANRMLRIMWKI